MALHVCEKRFDHSKRGPSVEYCKTMEDGTIWIGNDEYESMVNYCPFCGMKALSGAMNTFPPWGSSRHVDSRGNKSIDMMPR